MCKKVELTEVNIATAVSLPVCRLFCNEDVGTVWPKPTGSVRISNDVVIIDPSNINFKTESFKKEPAYWQMAEARFILMQSRKHPKRQSLKNGGKPLVIEVLADEDDMGKIF